MKNYEDNPAARFLKGQEAPERAQREIPEGYKLNPLYVEVKSKRVQLVLRPSTYEKARSAADAKGLSLNEYIHQLIEEAD